MQLEQYLSQRLGQTGPRKLPYEPTHHYTIRDHLLGLNKRFGLRVTDEEYFDASGSSQFLFKADGTVPMYYQRVQYNIPVQIWLPARYPKQAPVVYVVPTSNMIVKPNHSFVNMNGEVHADYVRQWCFPSYNLEDLVSYLQIRFGEDPPLFTRPENWESPPQPRPPQPSPQPAAQPHTAAHPPASAFHASNPLNPRPQTQPPPPTSTWPVRPPAQAQPDRDVLSSNPIWGGAYAAAQAAAGAARPSTSDPQSHPIGHVSPAATPAPTQPAPEPAKPVDPLDVDGDFKRAVLPGLTQRLQQTLRDYHATGKSEYASAREQRKELLERAEKVERVMASARAEKSALESSVSRMGSKIVEMDAWLRAHEHKLKGIDDAVDPEKVIVAVDPLNTQALEVRAEDMAIEDTLDALDRALERGDVDADAYMKQVRKLSRKQFFARSLCSLVRQAQQAHMQPQPAAGFPAGSVPQLAGHHGNLWGPPAPGGAAGPAASSGLTTTGSGSIHSSNPLAAYRT